ncbi:MAG: YIP1 family protein [Thermoclostridium sp.]|nr:YIP1 family protein [Thermoclostridium sp.]
MNKNLGSMETMEMDVPDKMSLFKRISCLLFSPSKLFLFVKKKPTVLFPIILICIAAIASQLLLWEPTKNLTMDTLYNTYKSVGADVSFEQIEQITNGSMIASLFVSPLTYLIVWLVTTLVAYLIYKLVKCEKGLKKYFSMTGYIMLITMAGLLINSVYIYLTGNVSTVMVTSLASLFDPDLSGTFIFTMASQIEVFNLWTFALFGMGFVYTGGTEKKKTYALTAILFVVVMLASAGLSLLSTGLQDSILGNMGAF